MSKSSYEILKITDDGLNKISDIAAVEEPLEISVISKGVKKNISVTMRTPGNDDELAAGFLFTEGIIDTFECIDKIIISENIALVYIKENFEINLNNSERNFYMTSSCGVCGKSSIDSVKINSKYKLEIFKNIVAKQIVLSLPQILREHQNIFDSTGGLHASGLFDYKGNFITLKEDVGRHNALDKLAGYALKNRMIPLKENTILLSGRASFELIQKASMLGAPVVCAVGAPSSLAIDLAKESNITLIGFLRDNRFNIYTNPERIEL